MQTKVSIEPHAAKVIRHIVVKSLPEKDPLNYLIESLRCTEFTSRRHVGYARGLLDGLSNG